jgi:hypothetical protein
MLFTADRADAGCGCDKPPPPPAAIRPAFASPGGTVTLFPPDLQDGAQYDVEFEQENSSMTVSGVAETRLDYADGLPALQLSVAAPALKPGPTAVIVHMDGEKKFELPASDFTMLPRPVKLFAGNAVMKAIRYRAAVGADGTLYLPLDLSAITARTVFTGLGKAGFPFTFDADDVTIYNVQGVVMESLATSTAPHQIDDGNAEPSNEADEQGPASSRLVYDRHEFETYRLRHMTDPLWLLDTADLAWHADGTRHIDHDHLVLAITGRLNGDEALDEGATNQFTLKISTVPEGTTDPAMVARVDWNDGTTTTVTATTSTSTTSMPPVCQFPGAGALLACLCDRKTLPVCDGDALPRSLTGPVRGACRLLGRSVREEGDVVAYLRGRAALRLERARQALARRRTEQSLSADCRAGLETALAIELP